MLIFREYVSLVGRSFSQAVTFLSSIVGGHLSYLRVRGSRFHSLTIPIKSPELRGLGIVYQFAQMDVRDVRDVFFLCYNPLFFLW